MVRSKPRVKRRGRTRSPEVLRDVEATFRPRARMLQLLGDQLIRDAHIAVFELLKNAYDADATEVTVTLSDIEDGDDASIVVEDDGSGMTFDTVMNVWLEPATDHRARQKSEGVRSPRFGRLPMGEKGIGRFAVHKLGKAVELVTRATDCDEVVVAVDWDALEEEEYLSDAALHIVERRPAVFVGRTGTRITVSRLRETWTRRMARSLRRSVTAMTSPFEDVASFRPELILDPDPEWFGDLLDPAGAINSALFHTRAEVDPDSWTMSYSYEFSPPRSTPWIEPRTSIQTNVTLGADDEARTGARYLRQLQEVATRARQEASNEGASDEDSTDEDASDEDASDEKKDAGVGEFDLDLHIFDLDRETRALLRLTDYRGLREFLAANGGIRVYRDGIRVYDYGEPQNDWLELDARRVNVPAQRISNALVLGAVRLDSLRSAGLVEKTNREGFVESPSYRLLRSAVQAAVQHVVFERNRDKQTLRDFAGRRHDATEPVTGALQALRSRVQKMGLQDDLGPLIDRAEREYEGFRETLLVTAGAGLTMTIVVHEVDKAVKQLNRALDREADRDRLLELGNHLAEVVDSLGFVARRSDRTSERASDLVDAALRTIEYRFSHHGIEVLNGFDASNDFPVTVQRRLVVGALLNLFDNAIYWLGALDPPVRRIYVGPSHDLGDAPAIVVADNGPGFLDPPDFVVQPFMTRKADGMGLGLYIANEVMRAHGGQLLFPSLGEAAVPGGHEGACVALMFKER